MPIHFFFDSTFYYALHEAICPSALSEVAVQVSCGGCKLLVPLTIFFSSEKVCLTMLWLFQEDPVVAFVKDAHEQKRKTLLSHWQGSERWQRIQRLLNPNGRSIAGSSIDRINPKTSASLQGVENDICHQLSEVFSSLCFLISI